MIKKAMAAALALSLGAAVFLVQACAPSKPALRAAPQPAPGQAVRPAADAPKEPQPPQAQPETATLPSIGKEDINGDSQFQEEKPGENSRDAQLLLESALAAVQEALSAAERDDSEGALAKLDEAYSLLLSLECPPDSTLAQEKNALRILIAQRINQVYARSLAPLPTVNRAIPLIENEWVLKEIKSFQTVERSFFLDAYKRSGLYRDLIAAELKKSGLPEELTWVPLIESGFKPRAMSRARALGMWQFIRSTGYRYGLKQDKYVDERMDPLKSTRAAIGYLTELHELFGDWTTALAAYNCGEMNVLRVIRAQKINYLDNFWDLFNNLPYETARYVPRFIAALLIIRDPGKYGFALPACEPALTFDTVQVVKPVKLASLAKAMELDPMLLVALNPELRHDSTPNYPYEIRVPSGYGDRCLAGLAELPTYVPADVVFQGWHVVRKGETLGSIASKYRTSVAAIARLNNLRNTRLIYPGQRLRIPGVPVASSAEGKNQDNNVEMSRAPEGATITYTVNQGDTLFEIARRFRTTVDKIRVDNGLAGDAINVGQKLVIQVGRS
jgi:membrane-bound lytic murein transglycosylase D